MKQVTVYEISNEYLEVIGNHVDVFERKAFDIKEPFCYSGCEHQYLLYSEAVTSYRLPVQTIRQKDGPDVYLAIGPKLKSLLLKSLEADNEERLAYQRKQLETEHRLVESIKLSYLADLKYTDQSIQKFKDLPLHLRIWKAIKKEI